MDDTHVTWKGGGAFTTNTSHTPGDATQSKPECHFGSKALFLKVRATLPSRHMMYCHKHTDLDHPHQQLLRRVPLAFYTGLPRHTTQKNFESAEAAQYKDINAPLTSNNMALWNQPTSNVRLERRGYLVCKAVGDLDIGPTFCSLPSNFEIVSRS